MRGKKGNHKGESFPPYTEGCFFPRCFFSFCLFLLSFFYAVGCLLFQGDYKGALPFITEGHRGFPPIVGINNRGVAPPYTEEDAFSSSVSFCFLLFMFFAFGGYREFPSIACCRHAGSIFPALFSRFFLIYFNFFILRRRLSVFVFSLITISLIIYSKHLKTGEI